MIERASVIERIDGMAVKGGRSSDDKMKAWFDGKWDEVIASRYISLRAEKVSPGIIDRNV